MSNSLTSRKFLTMDAKMVIESLKDNSVHMNLVSIIANIHIHIRQNCLATLHVNKKKSNKIEITVGICQGCNGSTMLFLPITYTIITALEDSWVGLTFLHYFMLMTAF